MKYYSKLLDNLYLKDQTIKRFGLFLEKFKIKCYLLKINGNI